MSFTNRYIFTISIVIVLLVNEFTIVQFNDNLQLGGTPLLLVRMFDAGFLLFAMLGGAIYKICFGYLQQLAMLLAGYVIPVVLGIVIIDMALGILALGYPMLRELEKNKEYPSPGDTFSGKPNTLKYNSLGFLGDFKHQEGVFSIAMFGGTASHDGDPTILEVVREHLVRQGVETNVYNFSSVNSNHTQHLHRLLKHYDKFKFDLVLFYGGADEIFGNHKYDPRPGYPYNFYLRDELSPIMQLLISYSSIMWVLDRLTQGYISGEGQLNAEVKDNRWLHERVAKYLRDLKVAEQITSKLVTPNVCDQPIFLSVTQPMNLPISDWNQYTYVFKEKISSVNVGWHHRDFTAYRDKIHFSNRHIIPQGSRTWLGYRVGDVVFDLYNSQCRN